MPVSRYFAPQNNCCGRTRGEDGLKVLKNSKALTSGDRSSLQKRRPERSSSWAGITEVHRDPCCRAGHRALRSVGRAARANKTSQNFIISAANVICASDDANCRCRAGVALRACRSCRAGRASGTLRAGGANWALATGLPLRTLRHQRALGRFVESFASSRLRTVILRRFGRSRPIDTWRVSVQTPHRPPWSSGSGPAHRQ
jgi:hypothetical protein